MDNKYVEPVLQHCCKTNWKVMQVSPPTTYVLTFLATNEVVPSCVTTDF